MKPVREYLKERPLLFDGAMGTWYRSLYPARDPRCELANLSHPADVLAIHRAYREAGAAALKTNTYGANTAALMADSGTVREILRAGYALAREAAGANAFVFADIGPILLPEKDAAAEYRRIAAVFLEMGAENFLFETFPSAEGLRETCAFIREQKPDAFLLVSFAATPDGFTRQGLPALRLAKEAAAYADAVGLNCVSGPAHLRRLAGGLPAGTVRSVMPNSGYPAIVGGRTYFESGAEYFAEQMSKIAASGVHILGGCCGTTPAHIARTAALLTAARPAGEPVSVSGPAQKKAPANRLREKLAAGKRVIAVEVDPPADADGSFFMEAAARLKAAGADAVTIADCPVARVRADSSLLAAKLKRELDMDAIPHMTCRDRNLNAAKALLLGLAMEGVQNILAITGDPIPGAEREEVKAVYNFNSAMLAGYIRALGEETLPAPFLIAGALNVNARNFDAELQKALRKKENGVELLMTQPVFTEEAVRNLRRAREETGLRILGGLMPPVSYRNASFMHNEIAGIRLSEEILARYEGLDREAAGKLGVSLCLESAEKIAPWVDGYYLITPFRRIDLIEELVRALR